MNGVTEEMPAPRSWWRERWVRYAGGVAVLHFVVFWVLSPKAEMGQAPRVPPRNAYVGDPVEHAERDEWLWLLNPGIFLAPSVHGFSGAAWLRGVPLPEPVEAPAPEFRPLPYPPTALAVAATPMMAREDPSPASRWTLPDPGPDLAAVPSVAFAEAGKVRVLGGGLTGWRLAEGSGLPAYDGEGIPGPCVVRLAVSESGEVAAPPILWTSSGVPEADARALREVVRLRWERGTGVVGVEPRTGSGLVWGWVEVEWAAASPARPAEKSEDRHAP